MALANRRSRRMPAPLGLLGMLALVLLIESRFPRDDIDFTGIWACNWRHAREAVREHAPGASILCLGDSLVQFGAIPKVIEAGTGRSTYSLALSAGSPPATYLMLRRALENEARPEAILLDYAPHSLDMGPRFSLDRWPELLDLRETLELAATWRDASLAASILVARWLPSYAARVELRDLVRAALRGDATFRLDRRAGILMHLRNWKVNRGANLAARNPDFHGADPNYLPQALTPTTWRCSPENRDYVRKTLDLAASRQITVFWVIPPFSPEIHEHRERLGLDDQYTRFTRDIQSRCPNVVVLDGRRRGYGPEVHVDPLHLDRQGAAVFSADVAELVARQLDAPGSLPRWNVLPFYRERPASVVLEDVRQSRAVLAARWSSAARQR